MSAVAGAADAACEVRRLRLDNWRIVYVISEHENRTYTDKSSAPQS